MPRNVEIKARVNDISALRDTARSLSGSEVVVLKQCDTFFHAEKGRLKLRETEGGTNQLIYYDRPDVSGPKLSQFVCYATSDSTTLKNILSLTNGVKGTVRKTRYLYMVGQTRVHVDQVEGLGEFMELEVQLSDDQTVDDGQSIANDLMEKLGVKSGNLLTGAYMDMLAKIKNGDL